MNIDRSGWERYARDRDDDRKRTHAVLAARTDLRNAVDDDEAIDRAARELVKALDAPAPQRWRSEPKFDPGQKVLTPAGVAATVVGLKEGVGQWLYECELGYIGSTIVYMERELTPAKT